MGKEIGSWEERLGNHRARILVSDKADAVWIHIPWRRRDAEPESKNVVVIDASNGEKVKNLVRASINREFGDIVFQATNAHCEYFVYYMPIEISEWRAFPKVTYTSPKSEADQSWISKHELTPDQLSEGKWKSLPKADFIELKSCSDFDRFGSMEMIATDEEKREMLLKYEESGYLLGAVS